jgi:hypothetical protein
MPTVTWTNGTIDSAADWQTLLDQVRATQWHAYDERKFREVMGRRARMWSGTKINIDGTAEQFMRELSYARMLTIDDETSTETDTYLIESRDNS